jgi:hypothetical protein
MPGFISMRGARRGSLKISSIWVGCREKSKTFRWRGVIPTLAAKSAAKVGHRANSGLEWATCAASVQGIGVKETSPV